MARLRYLERHKWIYATDKLLSPVYTGGPLSREEMVRLELEGRYPEWLTVSACISEMRGAVLGVHSALSISDLPESHEEVQEYTMYADLKGLDPSRMLECPLCDLSGLDYCRYLALCGLAGQLVPDDVYHWSRISLFESYRRTSHLKGDDNALHYLRRLPLIAGMVRDGL